MKYYFTVTRDKNLMNLVEMESDQIYIKEYNISNNFVYFLYNFKENYVC